MFINLTDIQRRRLINGLIAVVFLLAVFLGLKALNTLKEFRYIGGNVYPTNTINVTGKGTIVAIPDVAEVNFSVTETGNTVAVAQDKATKKMNTILDALKAMNIEEKDIKTTGYNSYPKYEYRTGGVCAGGYCPPGREVLTGYEVSQNITVKIRKTEEAGDVLTKIGSLGASNVSGLNFVVDDLEGVKKQAREEAIENAKEEAKVLARSLGLKLVKIVNFSEQGDYYPMYYGMGGMESKSISADMAVAQSAAPQLPVGENEIVSNVTIVYEVR
ncbi:MAG: SIMPL domain-containing protein [Patescibacteria group bacterium]